MNRWILALCLVCACASRPGPAVPAVDPHVAATAVVDALLAASAPDAEDSLDGWRAAYAAFERDLEPALRARHGDVEVARLEYGFARIRSRLGTGAAVELARQLGEQVASLSADLPRAGA